MNFLKTFNLGLNLLLLKNKNYKPYQMGWGD